MWLYITTAGTQFPGQSRRKLLARERLRCSRPRATGVPTDAFGRTVDESGWRFAAILAPHGLPTTTPPPPITTRAGSLSFAAVTAASRISPLTAGARGTVATRSTTLRSSSSRPPAAAAAKAWTLPGQVHFASDMWEPGNKHKFKKDAIPTIFGFFLKKQVPSKNIETDGSINADKITNINDTLEPTIDNVEKKEENLETVMITDTSERITDDVEHEVEIGTDITHDTNTPASTVNISSGSKTIQSDKEETEKYKGQMKKLRLRLIAMNNT
ncbi:PREDICTED: uncharacterized protein LOC105556924 [Vollenhovia emeryi]|uniref:uncharacterized protein LOC105556924 n=1 Tax=Vollenhovia emeryi TaxID=411798 RepID=UPI0005F4861C|nr:PREDICTED: uncharacterized protein LOC105556924 [Vollenhovia emeryi]